MSGRFFGLDCENVASVPLPKRRKMLAGRVVLVEWVEGRIEKRIDVYIRQPEELVDRQKLQQHYQYSHLTWEQITGPTAKKPEDVRERILSLITGESLILESFLSFLSETRVRPGLRGDNVSLLLRFRHHLFHVSFPSCGRKHTGDAGRQR